MLEAGASIDRYTVEAKLGEGATCEVYRVCHQGLGSVHALKVPRYPHPTLMARLRREGRVLAGLRHPNIIGVSDIIDVNGVPALVLELVDGPTLADWLTTHSPTLDDALELFRGIVAGVAAAHDAGVVHRDLKPANVLLADGNGGLPTPRIADFGLVADATEDSNLTRTGVGLGTPTWMAPEQLRNARAVDHRADIYSLGCILYRLVCGRPPFESDDLLLLMTDKAAGRYPPPDGAPAAVAQVIEAALSPDPDTRPITCAALLALLDTPAAPVPPPADPPEPVQSRRSWLGWAIGAAVLLSAGVAWQLRPTEPAQSEPVPVSTPAPPAVAAPPPEEAPPTPPDEPEPAPEAPAIVPAADPAPKTASPSAHRSPAEEASSARPPAEPDPPPPPEPGTVRVQGDHTVLLDGPWGRISPGRVPPGTYTVVAGFGGPDLVPAGTVEVRSGQVVTLTCNPITRSCTP
mgnify:FL=1